MSDAAVLKRLYQIHPPIIKAVRAALKKDHCDTQDIQRLCSALASVSTAIFTIRKSESLPGQIFDPEKSDPIDQTEIQRMLDLLSQESEDEE